MKHRLQQFVAAAASVLLCGALLTVSPVQASQANTEWKFDFGGGATEKGYIGVSASSDYQSGLGYGFSPGTSVVNVAASGNGALSDAVQFKNSSPNGNYTFCADVPNGLYQVSVWLGNTARTSIAIEGMRHTARALRNRSMPVSVSRGMSISIMYTAAFWNGRYLCRKAAAMSAHSALQTAVPITAR